MLLLRVVEGVERSQLGAATVLRIVTEQFAPSDVARAVGGLLDAPSHTTTDLYAAIVDVIAELQRDLLDRRPAVSDVQSRLIANSRFKDLTVTEVMDAVRTLAAASEGAARVSDSGLIALLVAPEEFRRRVESSVGPGAAPRRAGRFFARANPSTDLP